MSYAPDPDSGPVKRARHLERFDRVPWGHVWRTLTYLGRDDVEFTDIYVVTGQTFTVCADTLYQNGREVRR